MELSIIIPIYNTPIEKLRRCLNQIACLSEIKYECILVDDGSNEETATYLKNYSNTNRNFKYVGKENGGVSSARNLGIQQATAKYVCFVDSDDIVIPDAMSKVCNDLEQNEVDLLFTDLVAIGQKSVERWYAFQQQGSVRHKDVILRLACDGTLNGPYCKFIKKDVLTRNDLKFEESMVSGEDGFFLINLLQTNPRMWYKADVTYQYWRDPETGKRRFCTKPIQVIDDLILIHKEMLKAIAFSEIDAKSKDVCIKSLEERLVFNLFGYAVDGTEYNVLSAEIKEKLLSALSIVKEDRIASMSPRIKTRYKVLRNKRWSLFLLIAKIRQIYWKIKGLA
jgi:glycosyltransferase involved in cell wall biosynthesis